MTSDGTDFPFSPRLTMALDPLQAWLSFQCNDCEELFSMPNCGGFQYNISTVSNGDAQLAHALEIALRYKRIAPALVLAVSRCTMAMHVLLSKHDAAFLKALWHACLSSCVMTHSGLAIILVAVLLVMLVMIHMTVMSPAKASITVMMDVKLDINLLAMHS